MKKLVLLLLICIGNYGAVPFSFASELAAPTAEKMTKAEDVDNGDLLKRDKLFNEDGIVDEYGEKGRIDDVEYKFIYENGSGNFSGSRNGLVEYENKDNWKVRCDKDPMTDMKRCSLHNHDLWILIQGNGKEIVSIGDEHFPRSIVSLRINKSKPITTSSQYDGNYSSPVSKKIIKQLLDDDSEMVTTRYMKWPYREWEDNEIGLYGFNEAYSYIKWAIKRIK